MALSVQDTTNFNAMLKEYYKGTRVTNMAERKNPWFAMLKKDPAAGGDFIPQPVAISNPTGGSALIGTAITNSQASVYKSFALTLVDNFVVANVSNKAMETSKNANQAFDHARSEIQKAVAASGNRLARQLFRDSGGSIGVIDSTTTIGSAVLQLEDHGDVFAFWPGQTLVLGPNSAGTSIRSGSLLITGVNRSNGQVTMSGNITAGVAAAATGDYVFASGDQTACISGLAAWLPTTAPTGGDSFFGVDRSTDSFLYGLIVDGTGLEVKEAVLTAAALTSRHGGTPDLLLINPVKFNELVIDIGAKANYEMKGSTGSALVGFSSVELDCPGGRVKVVSDLNCPENRGYLLTSDTWKLYSAGTAPHIVDRDVLMLRSASTDNYETRVNSYTQLGCSSPGWNSVITFA